MVKLRTTQYGNVEYKHFTDVFTVIGAYDTFASTAASQTDVGASDVTFGVSQEIQLVVSER